MDMKAGYFSTENKIFNVLDVCMYKHDIPPELRLIIKLYLQNTIEESTNLQPLLKEAFDDYYQDIPFHESHVILSYGIVDFWDTSRVTNMNKAFEYSSINTPLRKVIPFNITHWNTSSVTSMISMFRSCIFSPNWHIEHWDVSKVTTMHAIFASSYGFNRPIGKWKIDNLQHASFMFQFCRHFNQSLVSWNTSNIKDTASMFDGATGMEWEWEIEDWDVSKLIHTGSMFKGCITFNRPLNKWNVSRVSYMSDMFDGCVSFNQPLHDWDTKNLVWCTKMFKNCAAYNQPMNTWNVKKVTSCDGMFIGATSLNQSFRHWFDGTQLTIASCGSSMFRNCRLLQRDEQEWELLKDLNPSQKMSFMQELGFPIDTY